MNRAILLLFITLMAMASCKTVTKKGTVAINGDKKPAEELIDSLKKHHLDFEWFSCRAKVDYEDNKRSENFTVNIRMRKDSVVWVSITSLMGIEVARMLITKDSVDVLNKLKHERTKRPFANLASYAPFPMTIGTLQDLLIGNYYLVKDGKTRSKIEKDYYVLEVDNDKLNAEYAFEPTAMNLDNLQMKEHGTSRKLNAEMSDYRADNGHTFSFERKLNFKGDKSKLILHIRFSKITWNEPTTFPFYVSEKND